MARCIYPPCDSWTLVTCTDLRVGSCSGDKSIELPRRVRLGGGWVWGAALVRDSTVFHSYEGHRLPRELFLHMTAFLFCESRYPSIGKINNKPRHKNQLKTKRINLNEAAMKQNLSNCQISAFISFHRSNRAAVGK